MTTSSLTVHSAWYDRWTKPSLAALIEPLKAHHRRQFQSFITRLETMAKAEQTIIWYGTSWRWTIAYTLPASAPGIAPGTPGSSPASGNGNGNGNSSKSSRNKAAAAPVEPEVLCYLVPSLENPLICVPMKETQVAAIYSKGTLGRYLKDGITNAKCAVQTRWATWAPAVESETTQLLDLLQKKYDLLAGDDTKPQNN